MHSTMEAEGSGSELHGISPLQMDEMEPSRFSSPTSSRRSSRFMKSCASRFASDGNIPAPCAFGDKGRPCSPSPIVKHLLPQNRYLARHKAKMGNKLSPLRRGGIGLLDGARFCGLVASYSRRGQALLKRDAHDHIKN
jgi:hypothetical protein